MALFHDGLLPATFRGVPFAVRQNATLFGRRLAIHQYPGRDDPWVEDMGRGIRRLRMTGFLVSGDRVYAGGPVELQRAILIAAAEKSGAGTLTHPTLGVLKVAVASLQVGDPMEAGTFSDVEFEFVEAGKSQFPSILTSTGSGLLSAGNLAKLAMVADVARVLTLAIRASGSRDSVAKSSAIWSAQTTALAGDATALVHLAALLPGNFGRFSQGGNIGVAGTFASPYSTDVTVADLVADASAQRAAVAAASADLNTTILGVASATSETDIVNAAQALVDSLAGACADPSDAIRLLTQLAGFAPSNVASQSVASVMGDAFRRAAAIDLAIVSASYQPESYDDAIRVLVAVTTVLDAEATIAADQALDDTFNTLRDLRTAVAQDLMARGGQLSPVRTFMTGASLPSLVLGQRLYRDSTRALELEREADPISPLFMPTQFQALAA